MSHIGVCGYEHKVPEGLLGALSSFGNFPKEDVIYISSISYIE